VVLFQLVDTPTAGTDWTQIGVTIVVTFGVCFTAVMSYLGVKAGRAAKDEAAKTQRYNAEDHGKVASAIQHLADKIDHLGGRVDDVGRNVGTLRDQFVGHLQHHIDKEA
jgi:hypothetical protein